MIFKQIKFASRCGHNMLNSSGWERTWEFGIEGVLHISKIYRARASPSDEVYGRTQVTYSFGEVPGCNEYNHYILNPTDSAINSYNENV